MSKFVWCEYVSPDARRAQAFFRDLFGWTAIEAAQGGYTMIANAGDPMGGYVDGPSPHWQPLLQTWTLDDTIATLVALGGAVHRPAFAVGDMGREAVVADPLGGAFALWQPVTRAYDGIDYRGVDGTWVWHELYTRDPDASLAFYQAIGGFTHKTLAMPGGGPGPSRYEILESDGRGRGGIMKMPGMPQMWMPYVQVANTDVAIEKATQLGAKFRVPAETIPGVGRFAVMIDPLGAPLGLLHPQPM